MQENRYENNMVCIKGRIVSELRYSHEVFGEKFYLLDIGAGRDSGYMDVIPLMVSEKLMDTGEDYTGRTVSVVGQLRSYNRHEEGKRRLELSVFVQDIRFPEEGEGDSSTHNRIALDGFLCKEPVYRKTPKGREIADILLAVNRPYGKSDYIPCIAWGRNAKQAARFEVGTAVKIRGRIQSREYVKQVSETEVENRVAYEVSITALEPEDALSGTV
ncbi:MAG TPA: single-stranded DNA-binding protein [Lachnospiraceae bacterium]|nr:single-stranded DNA-binding protein [Lachnospiraceae bacterium]